MHLIIDSSAAKGSEMMLSNAFVGWRQMCVGLHAQLQAGHQ